MTACVVIPAMRPEGAAHVLDRISGDCSRAVVVDNSGGAVGTLLAERAPWAEIVTPPENLGFGRAVDLAIRMTSEEIVVILNDDLEPSPGFMEHICAPFADHRVHHVAACLFIAGTDRIDSVGLAVDRTLRAENVRHFVADSPVPPIIGPSGAAAAYRRSTYLALGGFASDLFAYWEDTDLALRFWHAGHQCAFAPKAIAHHARGTALAGRSPRQRELDAFGRGFVLGRYRRWLTPYDRLLVPLVDWPSLARSCRRMRSAAPIRARRAGRKAGAAAPAATMLRGRVVATRRIVTTLTGQFRDLIRGPEVAVLPPDLHER